MLNMHRETSNSPKRVIPDTATIDRFACFAALVDPYEHTHDFFEAVARGAGFDFTLFRDRDLAVEHLHKAADRLKNNRGDRLTLLWAR